MSKNIVLLCSAGMSTSLLVNKIREAAANEDYDITVNAYAVSEAPEYVPAADLVLLGPQIRFNLKQLQGTYPDKKIEVIAIQDYGTMNGPNVVKKIHELVD